MLLTEAEAWVDFYLVAGAAAAVLIGLLFVALSINREATAQPHFGGQARQAVFALVSIFIVYLLVAVFDGAMLLIAAAGVGLVAGFEFALFLLAAAVIALSLLAIVNSWTLTLIGIEPGDS